MSGKLITLLLAILILLTAMKSPMTRAAEDSNPQAPEQQLEQGEKQETPQEIEQTAEKDTDATRPETGSESLKNRALGDAFRSFEPSEEISADNAVPFPVDI